MLPVLRAFGTRLKLQQILCHTAAWPRPPATRMTCASSSGVRLRRTAVGAS